MSSNQTFDNLFGSEEVKINGTKEQVYTGKLYNKNHLTFDLNKNDIVCITTSRTDVHNNWQHKLVKAFRPENDKQVSDYKEIEQGTHFIVVRLGNVLTTVDDLEEIKNSLDWNLL